MVAWSTTDKSANVTLSAGNLVATFTSATQGGVRCDTSVAVKTYVEFWYSAGSSWHVGFANATMPLGTQLGNTNDGFDANPSGNVRFNNGNVGQWGVAYLGGCCGIAWDPVAKLVWVSINGANWNNNALADPSTGVGGLSLSTINAGPWFPMFSAATSGASVIARFGAGDMAYRTPTGFSTMDTNVQAFVATPKFVSYALYNIPQAAASVFKLTSFAVLRPPQNAISVFKMVSYAILQPPPTNRRLDYNWPLPRSKWPKRWLDLKPSQSTNPNLFPGVVSGTPPGAYLEGMFRKYRRSIEPAFNPRALFPSSTPNFAYLLLASQ